MTQTMIKILTAIGSVILIITAGLHLGGLDDVNEILPSVESDFMQHALLTVWALLSFHLVFIACLAFGLSFYKSKACAAVLIAFGAWIIVDMLVILTHVGWFMAVPMLSVAGLCYLVAGIGLRKKLSL